MAVASGFYTAQADLILNPDDYITPGAGETNIGRIGSIHSASITPEFEYMTEHQYGTSIIDGRIVGVNASYSINLIDLNEDNLGILFNNTNDGDVWDGWNGYDLGDILGSSQTNELLVRPVDDDGDAVATKPFIYIPRALSIAAINAVWDKRTPHTIGWTLQILCLFDTSLGAPAAYGDYTEFPSLGAEE